MKRRAAAEPTIGHLKSDYRMERNRLKGHLGDALNALFSAAAMNFRKRLGFFWPFCSVYSPHSSCLALLFVGHVSPEVAFL
jgi:IS5 family transposase